MSGMFETYSAVQSLHDDPFAECANLMNKLDLLTEEQVRDKAGKIHEIRADINQASRLADQLRTLRNNMKDDDIISLNAELKSEIESFRDTTWPNALERFENILHPTDSHPFPEHFNPDDIHADDLTRAIKYLGSYVEECQYYTTEQTNELAQILNISYEKALILIKMLEPENDTCKTAITNMLRQ